MHGGVCIYGDPQRTATLVTKWLKDNWESPDLNSWKDVDKKKSVEKKSFKKYFFQLLWYSAITNEFSYPN